MNILMVSSYLPYPLFSGGHVRLYNIVRELSKNHHITLVCQKRDYQTQQDVNTVGRFCQKITAVPRKKQWTIGNVVKTGFSVNPFLLVGHTNKNLKTEIIKELSENYFDLIHAETFYIMQNIPDTKVPIVLAEQNIEYLVYQRFVKQAPFFLRPLLMIDVLKMKYWEEKFWAKASHIVAMSQGDKKIINRSNVTIVPNGVDLTKFKTQPFDYAQGKNSKFKTAKKEKTILFIGDFRWIENQDAATWLLKEIWPNLNGKWKMENGKLILWIVGKEIPNSLKRLTNDERVVFDEKAPDDTREIFARADLLLAPIRVGGGGKFKILEAMASGVPVVTTSIGIEGIEAKNKNQVLIGDNAQELVDKTIEILTNKNLYQKISRQARKLIEEKYDWKVIIRQLEDSYKQIFYNH